jgi:hypothetical protein
MVDQKILAKLKSVFRSDQIVPGRSGKVYRYPTWYGYYNEDGIRRRVYLGRELPELFKSLVPKKPKRLGLGRRRDPGVVQVADA